MERIKLKPCPFCGGTDLELKDYTEELYGFWDYKIRCRTCRAYMDSPSTAEVRVYDGVFRQRRDDETKAKAKRELIIAWNRRATESRATRAREIFAEIYALIDNAEEKLDILFIKVDYYRKGYENSVKHFRGCMDRFKKKYTEEKSDGNV